MTSTTLSFDQLVDAYYWGHKAQHCIDLTDTIARADQLLLSNNITEALKLYNSTPNTNTEVRTKAGYALYLLGNIMEALENLDETLCSKSSEGYAVLAAVHEAVPFRHPNYAEHHSRAIELIQLAVSSPSPSLYAIQVYLHIGRPYTNTQRSLELVNHGLARYHSPNLLAWRSKLLYAAGKIDDIDFEELSVAAAQSSTCTSTLLSLSLSCHRYHYILKAIDLLTQSLDIHQRAETANDEAMLRMIAHVCLGDSPNHQKELQRAYHAFMEQYPEGHLTLRKAAPLAHERAQHILILQIKVLSILGKKEETSHLASTLAELALSAEESPEYTHDFIDLGAFREPLTIIEATDLDQIDALIQTSPMWFAFRAALRLSKGYYEEEEAWSPDTNDIAIITESLDTVRLGCWVIEPLYESLLRQPKPNPSKLGKIAAHAAGVGFDELPKEKIERLGKKALKEFITTFSSELNIDTNLETFNIAPTWLLSTLHKNGLGTHAVQLVRKAHQHTPNGKYLFPLGYSLYNSEEYAEAAEVFTKLHNEDPSDYPTTRNLALSMLKIEDSNGLELLLHHVNSMLSEGASNWNSLKNEITEWLPALQKKTIERNRFEIATSMLEEINLKCKTLQFSPSDLSLPQATALIALMLSGEIDHATGNIGRINTGEVPFDPTGRFINLLGSLATSGVIGVSQILKSGVYVSDGKVALDWSEVSFKISPSTMDLQRQIRALSSKEWPQHWLHELDIFATSLAVEECMAYIFHLADERHLAIPDSADLRAVYRSHLQQASVGQCWYFTYRTIQSTSDYQVRYRAGQKQIASYMLRKLREIGEMALEKGWDTSYGRIRALPRSHMASALHDILTGWSENAFTTRIRDLVA